MSDLELILNMLAKSTTTEISRQEEPKTFVQNRKIAKRGGSVAGQARKNIEAETGKPVAKAAKRYIRNSNFYGYYVRIIV